jgi:hypothetical protein
LGETVAPRGLAAAFVAGAAITAVGFVAALLLLVIDGRRTSVTAAERGHQLPRLRELLQFDASFWYILGLHVLYASVFFPSAKRMRSSTCSTPST